MAIDWDRQLIDRYDPPSDEFLNEFERKLGVKLPRSYREFIKEYNGGTFKDGVEYVTDLFTEWGWYSAVFIWMCAVDPDPDRKHDILFHTANFQLDPVDDGRLCVMWGGHHVELELNEPHAGSVLISCEGEEHTVATSMQEFAALLSLGDSVQCFATIPVFRLVESGDDEGLRAYLDQGGDPNTMDEEGWPLISAAARQPHMVRALIEHGADVNASAPDGERPIHAAAIGSYDSLQIILRAGGNVNERANSGATPLMSVGDLRSFKLLIAEGADIHARRHDGCTVFEGAGSTTKRHLAVLLEAGYDLSYDLERLRIRLSKFTEVAPEIDAYELNLLREKLKILGPLAHPLLPDLQVLKSLATGRNAGRIRITIEGIEGKKNGTFQ